MYYYINDFEIEETSEYSYEQDIDAKNIKTLFISSKDENFLFTFQDDLMYGNNKYIPDLSSEKHDTFSYEYKNMKLHQVTTKNNLNTKIGYFHIDVIDSKGKANTLAGQVVGSPNKYNKENFESATVKLLDIIQLA